MKPKLPYHSTLVALTACFAGASLMQDASAATFTWDGGGADANWSTDSNWVGDPATGPADGDSLVFAGTANLNVNNDYITSLGANSFNFASGAGSFNVASSAGQIAVGSSGGNTNFVTQASANNQIISANIKLAGGGRDRTIIMSGAGSLTLSGNIDFSNDWLFPTTTAGTLILTGNNTGDGKGSVLTSGTNTMRAMMRNNVANTQLILGSNTALGNSGSGSIAGGDANLRGLVANANLFVGTNGSNLNLSGSSFIVNSSWIDFNGANNMTVSHLINQGGNRDFKVSSTGSFTIQNGLALSNDQTSRQLYMNISGSGSLVINGQINDTFHSGGITTTVTGGDGNATNSILRIANGTAYINGDNATSFNGDLRIHSGAKVVLGHDNALGSTGAGAGTDIDAGGTLDLNGHTTAENIYNLDGTGVGGLGAIVNSNTSNAAALTSDVTGFGNFTIGGNGDITASRFIAGAVRTVTKIGNGTLTTNGSSHNNLVTWDIQQGKVVLANTSGLGADRGVAINGGTLQIAGSNSDLINDAQSFSINSGSFDLNGKGEAIAGLDGSGGTVTNTNASTATLYVGGGSGGSASGSYAGALQDGTGVLNLTKEGTGTQTLSGTNSYSGATTISGGTLTLAATGSIDNTSGVSLGTGGTLDVSAKSGGYTVNNLTGSGTVVGALTVSAGLAIGNSPGTANFDSLSLGAGSVYTYELIGGGIDADLGNVAGTLTLESGAILDLVQLGTYTVGDKFTLFGYQSGNLAGTFDGLTDGAIFNDAGGDWQINYFDSSAGLNGGTGTNFVTVTAIPEPAAALLGGLGLLALFGRRRGN